MVRTTIRLPESLYAEVKRRAADERRSVQDTVTEALSDYVARPPMAKESGSPFGAYPMGTRTGKFRRADLYREREERIWKKG